MDLSRYKKFNKTILKTFVIIIVSFGFMNYFVNPYNIFDNSKIALSAKLLKPEAKIQERYTKFIGLKFDKRKIDTVFMGSSRPDWALNKYYYYETTGFQAENLAMGGVKPDEYIDIYEELIRIHPEVKNIYVFIDFVMALKPKGSDGSQSIDLGSGERYPIPKSKSLTSNEIGFALFSIQSSGNSIFTVFKNLAGIEKRMYKADGTKHIYYDEDIENAFKKNIEKYENTYKTTEFNEKSVELFENIYTTFKQDNRNVYFVIMPSHILDQYSIYKYSKKDYEKWKTALTKITDVYDFQYPHAYTKEPISPDMKYFFESSHATHILGDIILDVLNGNNKEYGHYLTSDNVDYYIKEDEKNMNVYIDANKDLFGKLLETGNNAI